jgi:hypothetical protein
MIHQARPSQGTFGGGDVRCLGRSNVFSCGLVRHQRSPFMFDELLSIEELEAGTRRIASDPRVRITPLGVSRLGRPIEMISLGEGDRQALVVGVPHANEPAGAVTVERLIALMLHSVRERKG